MSTAPRQATEGDPARLAGQADRAWAAGRRRQAADLRLQVLRSMLAQRDELEPVVDLADSESAQAVHDLEDALIERLIAPAGGEGGLAQAVGTVLNAEAALVARLTRSPG
jgi:hypothetical protein